MLDTYIFFFNGSKYAVKLLWLEKKLTPATLAPSHGGAVPLRRGSFHHAVLQLWPWLPVITGYFYGIDYTFYKWGDLLVLITDKWP